MSWEYHLISTRQKENKPTQVMNAYSTLETRTGDATFQDLREMSEQGYELVAIDEAVYYFKRLIAKPMATEAAPAIEI